jgi:RNA polymerase sigma factor, sigma-70 family
MIDKAKAMIIYLLIKLGFLYPLHYINGPQTLPPPLSADDEKKAIADWTNGSIAAREKLIVHNLRLVVYIAKKFENTGVGLEDLISIGTIGLIKAVETFKGDRQIKLATYASRCIENEILMHLRKVSRIKGEVSIDEPLGGDIEGNELLLSDILGSEPDAAYNKLETSVEHSLLRECVSQLNPRECEIMELRFGLSGRKPMTQKEVANMLDISQSYISRLEKKIIDGLKTQLEKLQL